MCLNFHLIFDLIPLKLRSLYILASLIFHHSDDIGHTAVLLHNFLVVAVALGWRAGLYLLAHEDVHPDVLFFADGKVEDARMTGQKLEVSPVLFGVPVVGG